MENTVEKKGNKKPIKSWVGWLFFIVIMVAVFGLGMLAASITERRSEIQAIQANHLTEIAPQEAKSELYATNYPREFGTWQQTADTTFKSKYMSSNAVDVLAERPAMVIFWAGYAFSREYGTPRGHMHAIEDVRNTLRTGSPGIDGMEDLQPATCWTCKGPDVPRMMKELGVAEYYGKKFSELGSEIVNPVGCADCHNSETMELQLSRPALVESLEGAGWNMSKVSHQYMRSLVCAQCHVEYHFDKGTNYLHFPWDKGFTVEAAEAYYDSLGFYDYVHPLSKTPILKAQHPDFELFLQGIHAQRGVSCADCHMPYTSEGGVKYTDHHATSPLQYVEKTCLTCHREDKDKLLKNVYDRQAKALEVRDQLEAALLKAHLEAEFVWKLGATETEMEPVLKLIRAAQFRWDYSVASHGASFHAPQEVVRIMSAGLNKAQEARLLIARVASAHGHNGEIPLPDVSTKELAQKYLGLDMDKLYEQKKAFKETVVPQWIEKAKAEGKLFIAQK